jgi:hypothetical protein
MLKQRRLFWIAVGAGTATVVWLFAYFSLAYATRDNRYLVIRIDGEEQQAAVVEALGECRGRFKILQTSESNEFWIPVKSLGASDYTCLFDKLQKAIVRIDPEKQPKAFDGKVLLKPTVKIEKWE